MILKYRLKLSCQPVSDRGSSSIPSNLLQQLLYLQEPSLVFQKTMTVKSVPKSHQVARTPNIITFQLPKVIESAGSTNEAKNQQLHKHTY